MRRALFGILASLLAVYEAPALGRSDHDREAREPRDRTDRDSDRTRDTRDSHERDSGGRTDQQRSSSESGGSGGHGDGSISSGGTSESASRSSGSNSGSSTSGVHGDNGSGSSSGSDESSSQSSGSNSGSGSSGSGSGEVSVSSSGSGDDGGGDNSGSGSNSGSGNSGSGGGSDDGGDDDEDSSSSASASAPVHVEVDREGHERRAAELLLVGRDSDVAAAVGRGYAVISRHALQGSEGVVARLHVRDGESVDAAVAAVHALAPDAQVSPNFLFRPSGVAVAGFAATGASAPGGHGRVGIIDTGIDARNARLRGAVTAMRSFVGAYVPRDHGTGVAQVAVASGVTVSSVDVFTVDESGAPAASVDAIVRGLDWFIAQRESVVNVSITGPNNSVLANMVARAQQRGMVIVAAAGNDGPSAAPAFPAALDGVIAVTAIDQSGHVYRRANRGAYIDFAALGVHVGVAGGDGAVHPVSGTSFAAPRVAALLAKRLLREPGQDPARVVRQLATEARDLGPRGRDSTYGWGGVLE